MILATGYTITRRKITEKPSNDRFGAVGAVGNGQLVDRQREYLIESGRESRRDTGHIDGLSGLAKTAF